MTTKLVRGNGLQEDRLNELHALLETVLLLQDKCPVYYIRTVHGRKPNGLTRVDLQRMD
jgi:hypothetical protein